MGIRFKSKSQIFDIGITALGAIFSVGVVLYGVIHLGLKETWPELVLNLFYIACVVMIVLYFFNRMDDRRFNYSSSVCIGITVLLRDILFPPPLENYFIHLACLVLAVMLLVLLTFFYGRKEWKTYTKGNLWALFIIDMLIAGLYNYVIYNNPVNEYTNYLLTEIWIRPTILYGLVACYTKKET